MEDNPDVKASLKNLEYDTCLKKRMVVVLSKDDLKRRRQKCDRTADPLSGRSEIPEISDLRMRRESDLESFLLTN